MEPAGCDRGERTCGRICLTVAVVAPALGGAVGSEPTRMVPAGCDGGERTCGRICLTVAVVAPALGGAVASEPTRMARAGCDGGERALWRGIRLSVAVWAGGVDGYLWFVLVAV